MPEEKEVSEKYGLNQLVGLTQKALTWKPDKCNCIPYAFFIAECIRKANSSKLFSDLQTEISYHPSTAIDAFQFMEGKDQLVANMFLADGLMRLCTDLAALTGMPKLASEIFFGIMNIPHHKKHAKDFNAAFNKLRENLKVSLMETRFQYADKNKGASKIAQTSVEGLRVRLDVQEWLLLEWLSGNYADLGVHAAIVSSHSISYLDEVYKEVKSGARTARSRAKLEEVGTEEGVGVGEETG